MTTRYAILADMARSGATLAQIGTRLGVTRERARQLLNRHALNELRMGKKARKRKEALRVAAECARSTDELQALTGIKAVRATYIKANLTYQFWCASPQGRIALSILRWLKHEGASARIQHHRRHSYALFLGNERVEIHYSFRGYATVKGALPYFHISRHTAVQPCVTVLPSGSIFYLPPNAPVGLHVFIPVTESWTYSMHQQWWTLKGRLDEKGQEALLDLIFPKAPQTRFAVHCRICRTDLVIAREHRGKHIEECLANLARPRKLGDKP